MVRASWRRFRGWRREGSQVGRGRRSRTPHPGEERTSAGSCGPLRVPGGGTPHLPLGPGSAWGSAGSGRSRGRQLASPKGGGVGRLAQGAPLSSGSAPALGGQALRAAVCFRTGCLGVCEAVALALALRVPWASGQKLLSLRVTDVCWGHRTILRAAALIPPFPGGTRASATAGRSSSPSQPAGPPPSPHTQGGVPWECYPQPALTSGTVSSASAWPFTGSTWVRFTEQTEWSNES